MAFKQKLKPHRDAEFSNIMLFLSIYFSDIIAGSARDATKESNKIEKFIT